MSKFSYKKVKPTTVKMRGQIYKFRSKAEAVYANKLERRRRAGAIADWQYEPQFFKFKTSPFAKVRGYLPDFLITEMNGGQHFVEIKGRMDSASQQKIKLFREQYPEHELKVIMTNSYEFRTIKHIHHQIKKT